MARTLTIITTALIIRTMIVTNYMMDDININEKLVTTINATSTTEAKCTVPNPRVTL